MSRLERALGVLLGDLPRVEDTRPPLTVRDLPAVFACYALVFIGLPALLWFAPVLSRVFAP